jgi:hypothetical protein
MTDNRITSMENYCEEISAAVFSSDFLNLPEVRIMLLKYMARWTNAVAEHQEIAESEATKEDPNDGRSPFYM